jgi:hypothetical protein
MMFLVDTKVDLQYNNGGVGMDRIGNQGNAVDVLYLTS